MTASTSIDIVVSCILSDMDGTLVDSTPAVEKTMSDWANSQGIVPSEFFKHSREDDGVRTRDNLRRFQTRPILGSEMSEAQLDAEVERLEGLIAENGRILAEAGGRGIVILPGAAELLRDLREKGARFGIVTSASAVYARSALTTAAIVPPTLPFLITAEKCLHGKPHPEPYLQGLKAAAQLDGPPFDPSSVLVLEDAPSGLASGLAAGCQTLAVLTGGQPIEKMLLLEATYKVLDLTRVKVISVVDGLITLRITPLESTL